MKRRIMKKHEHCIHAVEFPFAHKGIRVYVYEITFNGFFKSSHKQES